VFASVTYWDFLRPSNPQRRLKNCTARSCASAARLVAKVPRFLRFPVLAFFLREYRRYFPLLSLRIIFPPTRNSVMQPFVCDSLSALRRVWMQVRAFVLRNALVSKAPTSTPRSILFSLAPAWLRANACSIPCRDRRSVRAANLGEPSVLWLAIVSRRAPVALRQRAELSRDRLRSPALGKQRRACLLVCDASPHARILRLACWEPFPRARPHEHVPQSVFPA